MAELQPSTSVSCNSTETQTIVLDKEEKEQSQPVLQLRLQQPLQQPKNEQKVKWTTDTVDNEFMGKKKSKCCCIYEKPKVFGESDTSSDEEEEDDCTKHCRGHKKKCYRHHTHKPDEFKDPDFSSPDNNDSSKHYDASGSASSSNEV